MRRSAFIIPVLVVLAVGALSSIFVVDEREKALVLQFGQIKAIKEEPGLAFKIPFIQEVVKYDDRILSLDTDVIEVTPSDDRRLVVDAFARYRIADLQQFRQAVGVGGVRAAEDRLESILNAQVREPLPVGLIAVELQCPAGTAISAREQDACMARGPRVAAGRTVDTGQQLAYRHRRLRPRSTRVVGISDDTALTGGEQPPLAVGDIQQRDTVGLQGLQRRLERVIGYRQPRRSDGRLEGS